MTKNSNNSESESSKFRAVALSTIDNPYDPITQFDEWYQYDVFNGYNSCEYLARIATPSRDLGNNSYNDAIETAIDEIVRLNPFGIYKKVVH